MEILNWIIGSSLIAEWDCMFWTLGIIISVVSGFLLFMNYFDFSKAEKKICCTCLVIGLIMFGLSSISLNYHGPIELEKAQEKLNADFLAKQEKAEILRNENFFIKEMGAGSYTAVDLSGETSGSFFLASGQIIGSIAGTSDQKQVITITYYDNDTIIDETVNVHRVISFDLEKICIITTDSGAKPFYRYADCYVRHGEVYTESNKIEIENPTFYLPEGWQIIGANQ